MAASLPAGWLGPPLVAVVGCFALVNDDGSRGFFSSIVLSLDRVPLVAVDSVSRGVALLLPAAPKMEISRKKLHAANVFTLLLRSIASFCSMARSLGDAVGRAAWCGYVHSSRRRHSRPITVSLCTRLQDMHRIHFPMLLTSLLSKTGMETTRKKCDRNGI